MFLSLLHRKTYLNLIYPKRNNVNGMVLHSNKYIIKQKNVWKYTLENINQIYKACFHRTLAHSVHLVNYFWSNGRSAAESNGNFVHQNCFIGMIKRTTTMRGLFG